jgi:hypothetical protein
MNSESKQIKRQLRNLRRTLARTQKMIATGRDLVALNQRMVDRLKSGHLEDLALGISATHAIAALEAAIAGQLQAMARMELGLEPLRQMIRELEVPGMTFERANAIAETAHRDSHRNFTAPMD